eukprot:gnl/TRDRNA2_/TRDRNA2_176587_c0_seq1.p1 gnl/TRDRNA2_/TRDRNA2_176587_c0~~gnl/TRDRNA2_/TRDRNA2_176587_c0_seq1.p1  ORF type:complete len:114 (-),score=0.04 gnl/TRDRNA2_/TRDRNA2_176587_c0_seq1:112-453(-)
MIEKQTKLLAKLRKWVREEYNLYQTENPRFKYCESPLAYKVDQMYFLIENVLMLVPELQSHLIGHNLHQIEIGHREDNILVQEIEFSIVNNITFLLRKLDAQIDKIVRSYQKS